MRKILSLILVCGIITTMFTGCGLLDKLGKGSGNNDELTPVSSVTMGEDESSGLKGKSPVQLYFINEQENKLSSETRYIQTADTGKGSEHLATIVLKELINGPAKGSLLKASIPQGTKVHANVTIKKGVATVDLSKEFVDKHPGGKKNEQLTLYSVVNTLTEIKDITSVQFKINGKVAKEFKGSYQIDAPYPRSAYLISAQPAENNAIKKQDETKDKQTEPSKKDDTKKPASDSKSKSDVETNGEVLE